MLLVRGVNRLEIPRSILGIQMLTKSGRNDMTAIKRTPVKRKRATPRRGRVVDKAYLEWASTQPCCITGKYPATSHHVRFFGSQKNDQRIVRLIPELHIHECGMFSIERVGTAAFQDLYGISIEDEIRKLRERYEREVLGVRTDGYSVRE